MALTVPERLASRHALVEVRRGGLWVELSRAASADAPLVVLPTVQVWPDRLSGTGRPDPRSAPSDDGSIARVRLGIRSVAASSVTVALGAAKTMVRQPGTDVGWWSDGRTPQVLSAHGSRTPLPHADDARAEQSGATLADVLRVGGGNGVIAPGWHTATQPGWVLGGELGLTCEQCSKALLWGDWWHAQATRMRNVAFVFCPAHGGPVRRHRGRPLAPLLDARRRLDAALHLDPPGSTSVYVLEVLGLETGAVYVGETSKDPEVRRQEHISGIRAGKVFKRQGVSVGDLLQCLRPSSATSATLGDAQGKAAEQWTGFVLRERGHQVFGAH